MVTGDNILSNIEATPYDDEIDQALKPHTAILMQLILDDGKVSARDSPAKGWLQERRDMKAKGISATLIFYGNLTINDRAKINNWIWRNIPAAKTNTMLWVALLPVVHAATLLLAHRLNAEHILLSDCPPEADPERRSHFLLQKAWDFQKDWSKTIPHSIDVDEEAIYNLEKRMFINSKESKAGDAGYYQWGLDSGSHQNKWTPYLDLPADWSWESKEYADSDSDLEVSQIRS